MTEDLVEEQGANSQASGVTESLVKDESVPGRTCCSLDSIACSKMQQKATKNLFLILLL